MTDICKGSLVYSRAGKDKGSLFLVLSLKGEYVYLVDGDTRKLINPKKKKLKHINKTNKVCELDFENLSDSAVRKALMTKAEC